jgi:hypothetical protein
MLVFSLFPIVSLIAFVFIASTRVQVTSGRLGAGFILWISYTAVSGRLLSALGQLDQTALWLGVELLPVFVVFAFLRADLIKCWSSVERTFLGAISATKSMIRTVWVLPVLVIVVITYYAIGLFANISLPQTVDDALTAYLARAGFWITSGSMNFLETSSYNVPLVTYPALPTLSTVRWITLTGTDHMAVFDQWMSALISANLVYALGRRLHLTSGVSATTAALWLLMPVTILQSQMALHDLVAIVAVLTTILLSSHLFNEFRLTDLSIAFLAGFVAIGTKQTVVFMAPSAVFALVIGMWIYREKKIWRHLFGKRIAIYAACLTLLGLFLSFPEYFFNQRRFGHPLGPSESFGYFADTSANFETRITSIGTNVRRIFAAGSFGDVPRSIAEQLPNFYAKVREYYPEAGYEVSRISGVGWFGTTVTVLALVGLTFSLPIAWKRGKLVSYCLLIGGATLYTVLFMYTRPNFSEAFSRYMLFPITLLLIAGGFTLDALLSLPQKRVTKVLAQLAVVTLISIAGVQSAWSFFGNGVRPLAGKDAVWNLSDDEILMLSNGFGDRGAFIPMLQQVSECMPSQASIATGLPYKFPLALLFGDSYSRRVTMLNPPAGVVIDFKFLRMGKFDGIILHDDVKNASVIDVGGLWSQSYGPYTLIRMPVEIQNCG